MADLGYGVDSETDVATRRRENDAKKKHQQDDRDAMPPPPVRKIRYDSTPDAIDAIFKAAVDRSDARSSEDYYVNVPSSQKAIVGTYRRNNYTNTVERVTCGADSDPDMLQRMGTMTEAQTIAYLRNRRDEESMPAPKPSMGSLSITAGIQQQAMYTVMTRDPTHTEDEDDDGPKDDAAPACLVDQSYEVLRDDQRQRGHGREKPIDTDPRVMSMRSQRLQNKLNRVKNVSLSDLVSKKKTKRAEEDSSSESPAPKRTRTG